MSTISFATKGTFYNDVKGRVNRYFDENQLSKKGDWRLYSKTAIIFSLIGLSYYWAVFQAAGIGSALAAIVVLAQGLALVGFNVMHDGSHGSYSSSRRINWLMGFTLDLVGGSNKMWRASHNVSHHMFTNIDGHDADLFTNGLLRFSPVQPHKLHHRLQQIYLFLIYGFISLWWVTTRDIEYFIFKVGPKENRTTLTTKEGLLLIATKIFYYTVALGIPMMFHSVTNVLLCFLFSHLVLGLTLTTVFQLAHTTENVAFPEPAANSTQIENEWAAHQVETTADFAPNSRFAAWYLGGLNYQIEHHLFSSISHVHYPALSKIVREACADHGVKYFCYPTFTSALAAHLRFIARMGRPDEGRAARTLEPLEAEPLLTEPALTSASDIAAQPSL